MYGLTFIVPVLYGWEMSTAGSEGPGHGRGHVPGQGVDVGPERQGQHAVHHGGGLRYALVAHVVPQQRVHKKPHTRPGFPREHVRFQPLPGYFLQGVFHTAARASMSEKATTRTPSFLTVRCSGSRHIWVTLASARAVSGTAGALGLYSAATP